MAFNFSLSYDTGTTKIKNLDDNIGSLALKLTEESSKEICDAVPVEEVGGHSNYAYLTKYEYKYANTPTK